jgi:hypothetical protein
MLKNIIIVILLALNLAFLWFFALDFLDRRDISKRPVPSNSLQHYLKYTFMNLDSLEEKLRYDRTSYKDTPDPIFKNQKRLSFLNETPLTRDKAEKLSHILNKKVLDLFFALNQKKLKYFNSLEVTNQLSFDIQDSFFENNHILVKKDYENQTITIENLGEEIVNNVKVVANNLDVTSLEAIKKHLSIQHPNKESAMKIHRFLFEHLTHQYPAHIHFETHDPVKMLNVYGYGICDDYATNFKTLYQSIGGKARVWGLNGHVTSEVYYNNKWHMIDSNMQSFYEKNGDILSVKELEENPQTILNSTIPTKVRQYQLYSTPEDNKVSEYWSAKFPIHKIELQLRPGESFTWSQLAQDKYFASVYFGEPPIHSMGIFEADLIKASDFWTTKNLEIHQKTVSIKSNEGHLQLDFECPYPYISSELTFDLQPSQKRKVSCRISRDQVNWDEIPCHVTSEGQAVFLITPWLKNGYGSPDYGFSLQLIFRGKKGDLFVLNKAKLRCTTQLATLAIPKLKKGHNSIQYFSSSPNQKVNLNYQFYNSPRTSAKK